MAAGALVRPFPMPLTPGLQRAFADLYLAENGTDRERRIIGDPAKLPRPWDPATITDPTLREETWAWLDGVVTWFNTQYVWDPNLGVIPACWPHHPHLVHEIATLADQRRRAGIATASDQLEDWHRYCVPAFLERLRARTKTQCDADHTPWPARGRHTRHTSEQWTRDRAEAYLTDVATLARERIQEHQQVLNRPTLHIIQDEGGDTIKLDTGEVL